MVRQEAAAARAKPKVYPLERAQRAGERTRGSWHPGTCADGAGSGRGACTGSGGTHATRQGSNARESARREPMTALTNEACSQDSVAW